MSEIAEIRRRAGLSQEKFAEKLGVDQSTVSRWERDVVKVDDLTLSGIRARFPGTTSDRPSAEAAA